MYKENIIILFAILNSIFFCMSIYMTTKKKIISVAIICDITGLLKYILVGGVSGTINLALALSKDCSYVFVKSKKATITFSVMRTIFLLICYENVMTLFFAGFEVLQLVMLLKYSAQKYRGTACLKQIVWVFYDFKVGGTFFGILSIVELIIITFAMYIRRETRTEEEAIC